MVSLAQIRWAIVGTYGSRTLDEEEQSNARPYPHRVGLNPRSVALDVEGVLAAFSDDCAQFFQRGIQCGFVGATHY